MPPFKMQRTGEIITDPTKAIIAVGKENSELHEELRTVYKELDWCRGGLKFISEMPNEAGPVATKVLLKQPYKS